MTEDMVTSLQQLQRYAAGVHQLLTRAQAGTRERVEATDRSGAVRAVLGPDGLPESIVVDADWRRVLAPDGFAAAVVEACQAAAGERMSAVSRALRDHGAHARAGRLREELAEQAPPAPVDPLPAGLRDQVNRMQPRPLGELAEDVLRAADDVDRLAAASPFAVIGRGADASGRIVVTVSRAGLVSCEAEPRWLSRQGGTVLTGALTEAIGVALADLARGSHRPDPAGELDRLFAEALAVLNGLQRPAQS